MGVTYLLDTHVFLWLVGSPERVQDSVRDRLADRANRLVVSAVSAFEVATKARLGRLVPGDLLDAWDRRVAEIGAEQVGITAAHALLAGRLTWEHRDPFDRLLVAQATLDGATLVTIDRVLARLPVPTVLTW